MNEVFDEFMNMPDNYNPVEPNQANTNNSNAPMTPEEAFNEASNLDGYIPEDFGTPIESYQDSWPSPNEAPNPTATDAPKVKTRTDELRAKYIEEINAQELRAKKFMPIVWAVEGFLPEGLAVLAGSPKVGKSRLGLHLSLGIAIGGCVLGKINVEQGDVLYLALEDTQRRLQERINSILPSDIDISKLTLTTAVPRQHEGGLEYIRSWLGEHENPRLVIIDTLQKFRKQNSGRANVYGEDYDAVSEIKKLADEFRVPFLLIHHLKKATAEDWLNEISGSQGIAGAADTILALKRNRTDSIGLLHRTGRDVEETDFIMELDEETGWILGDEVEPEKPKLSATQQKIIDYLTENGVKTPQAIANALGISQNTVQGTLRRLLSKGAVEQNSYGSYSITERLTE